jgi:cell division protein FtsL
MMSIYERQNSAYVWDPKSRIIPGSSRNAKKAEDLIGRRGGFYDIPEREASGRSRSDSRKRRKTNPKPRPRHNSVEESLDADVAQTAVPEVKRKKITAAQKIRMILTVMIFGVCLLFVVSMAVKKTAIQSHIAASSAKIMMLEEDISSLNMQFEKECNLKALSDKAKELGLIVPDGDQIVYIDPKQPGTAPEDVDLAQYIRENAYEW